MKTGPRPKALSMRVFWLVLIVWAVLYLPGLRTSPHWYGDETIAVLLAQNLARGELALGAVANTFFTAVYQPLYIGWLALGWLVWPDIVSARFLTAVLALATAVCLLLMGRKIFGLAAAAAMAVLFLAYDQSILHFRQAFPHNGVCLGATMAVLASCLSGRSRRMAWIAGAGCAIAVGSHPMGIYVVAACGIAKIFQPRVWLPLVVPSAVVMSALYLPVILKYGAWVWEDLLTLAGSYGSDAAEHQSNLVENLRIFYMQDVFHALGAAGLGVLAVHRLRRRTAPILLFFAVTSLALFSNRSNLTVFYYQAVPLVPFLALGCVFAGRVGVGMVARLLRAQIDRTSSRWVMRYSLVGISLAVAVPTLPAIASGTLRQRNFPWVTQSPREVETVAEWINSQAGPDDLVIANSNISWLLKTKTSNLFQWTAWDGVTSFMYVKPVARERFRENLDLKNIRFLVLGDIDMRWGVHQENVPAMLERHGVSQWPVVLRGEHYIVLENPQFAGGTNGRP